MSKEQKTCKRTASSIDKGLGKEFYFTCERPVKWIISHVDFRGDLKYEAVCGSHMQVSKKFHERGMKRGYDNKFTCEPIKTEHP